MEDKYNDEMYDTLRDNEGDTEQCFCPSYYKVNYYKTISTHREEVKG